MGETFDTIELLGYYPPELLENIFIYLPTKSLIRFRAVNRMWRDVIDDLSRNENMWRRNCKDDFSHVYEVARRKAKPGLRWFSLYRSLSLWRLLRNSAQKRGEFIASSNSPLTEIRSFKILNDGVIGILQEGSVTYYDIETLALSYRLPMLGNYAKYTETDNFVVILSTSLHMHIMRKISQNQMIEPPALTYNNVKQFALIGHELFFVSFQDEIFVCDLRCATLHANFMARLSDRIMSIGYSDGYFNVLTFQRNVFAYVQKTFVKKARLSLYSNLIPQLQANQLLNQMDWRVYYQWMSEVNREIPEGPLRDVKMVKHYGDVYFVGSYWGELRIYYWKITRGKFDINRCRPVKQFNFMNPTERNTKLICTCPILQVDVMEGVDGHTVFVAMPRRIVVLYLSHNFQTVRSRTSTTQPMLPEIKELPEISEQDLAAAGPSRQQ